MKKLFLLFHTLIAPAAFAQTDATILRLRDVGPNSVLGLTNIQANNTLLNLFVRTDGSDAAGRKCTANTAAGACRTIAHAVDLIPRTLNAPVVVTVGPGTFTGAIVSGFHHYETLTGNPAEIGTITIQGTMKTFVPATGTASGTVTARTEATATAQATMTDAAQTWTVDNLRGRLLRFTSGADTGQTRMIASNTATVITLAGTFGLGSLQNGGVLPTVGDAYTIDDWDTTIDTGLGPPARHDNFGTAFGAATRFGFQIFPGDSTQTIAPMILVSQMRFAGATINIAVFASGSAPGFVARCRFDTTTVGANAITSNAPISVSVGLSSALLPATGSYFVQNSRAPNSAAFIRENVVNGGVTAIGTNANTLSGTMLAQNNSIVGASGITFTAGALDSYFLTNIIDCVAPTGANFGFRNTTNAQSRGIGTNFLSGNTINNCGVAVSLGGKGMLGLTTSVPGQGLTSAANTGAGNTLGIQVYEGGSYELQAADAIGAVTSEVQIDGVNYTLANVRALTPKTISNTASTSIVYQN